MSRRTWSLIKQSKRFYVRLYRRTINLLLVSVTLNVLLGLGIWQWHPDRPDSDFYATFGETPPVLLKAMETPNYQSVPLLPNDPSQDSDERTVLQ